MSYVCFNKIAITGPRSKVLGFRNDARRRLSQALKGSLGAPYVEFSLECLFRRNRLPMPSPYGIPFDAFQLGNDIEQRYKFIAHRIEARQIRPLPQVAAVTCQGQIAVFVAATVLPGHDVLDVVG